MNMFSSLQHIQWREPLWLLLSLQPFVIMFLKYVLQKNNLSLFAERKLHPWLVFPTQITTRNIFSYFLNKKTAYFLAWILFSSALAGPRIAQTNNQTIAHGANIMLVVDISKSMQANDIAPTRLRRAKIEIHELLEKAQGHRIGITVFAARPHLFVPLTTDHNALKSYLQMLDQLELPTSGSKPLDAIVLAGKKLKKFTGPAAIVLLTDGDFSTAEIQNHKEKLSTIAAEEIPLYILGLGSVEGEAILLKDGTWLKHKGNAVVSKMQEKALYSLASEYSGDYSPGYDTDADWVTLYENGIKKLVADKSSPTLTKRQYKDLFMYFLLPSLFFFLIALNPYLIRSALQHDKKLSVSKYAKLMPLIILFLFITVPTHSVFAFDLIKTAEEKAYEAYIADEYIQSEKHFKNEAGYKGYFGQACALYKRGHYQNAVTKFSQAVLLAESDQQRAAALFNLANAYFRSGNFTDAIATYHDVLRYLPKHAASQHNLNVSKILQKNIELRIKEKQELYAAIKQGRGPRSAQSKENEAINENTSVSIGSESTLKNSKIPLPELPNINEDSINKLIFKGLENIKLAERSSLSPNNKKAIQLNRNNTFYQEQYINTLSDTKHLLWKRVFEIEEGFPAPVEEARSLPGVKPW